MLNKFCFNKIEFEKDTLRRVFFLDKTEISKKNISLQKNKNKFLQIYKITKLWKVFFQKHFTEIL